MGEGILRAKTNYDPEISVNSAGLDTTGMREKYDNRPHPKVIFVMQEIGIDISNQQITQVTPELLEDSTQIIILTSEQELPDYFQNYRDKMFIFPIEDPAPGDTDDVELQRLRDIRDQIELAMSQIDLSYNL
ncbi:hypothetical protein BH09PAT2_BH09PAT2_01080 [soil metagenome]